MNNTVVTMTALFLRLADRLSESGSEKCAPPPNFRYVAIIRALRLRCVFERDRQTRVALMYGTRAEIHADRRQDDKNERIRTHKRIEPETDDNQNDPPVAEREYIIQRERNSHRDCEIYHGYVHALTSFDKIPLKSTIIDLILPHAFFKCNKITPPPKILIDF